MTTIRRPVQCVLALLACSLAELAFPIRASAQPTPGGVCNPVSERKTTLGCWIIAHDQLGALPESQTFWHLDTYPTRAAAQAAKGPHGTVVESLGKVWLLTVEKSGWRPRGGQRVTEIGPIPIHAGASYSAQYMEVVFTPGMTSSIHRHGGPEIWYTLAGETCLETPDGKQVGRAGGPPVIIPDGPMHLTATGTVERRALVLILHDSSQPATTVAHDWTPKGLCKS